MYWGICNLNIIRHKGLQSGDTMLSYYWGYIYNNLNIKFRQANSGDTILSYYWAAIQLEYFPLLTSTVFSQFILSYVSIQNMLV